jgi:hypothetical protein
LEVSADLVVSGYPVLDLVGGGQAGAIELLGTRGYAVRLLPTFFVTPSAEIQRSST